MKRWFIRLLALSAAALALRADGAEVHVAVAAHFMPAIRPIAQAFHEHSGHRVVASAGSTGGLAAQILHGAPYDVFLAADQQTPRRLLQSGHALEEGRLTYATGRLVLWSADPGLVDPQGQVLSSVPVRRLAVANPRVSPYGRAALAVLAGLGLEAAYRGRLVQGENIAQAHQFVSSGNAELGLLALSQVMREGRLSAGSVWLVPASLHEPLRHDAVLLKRAAQAPAAREFMNFLRSDKVRAIIRAHGYDD